MANSRKKTEQIHVRLTAEHKKRLEDIAESSNLPVSEYLVRKGLELNIESAKFDFYNNINNDLRILKNAVKEIQKKLEEADSEYVKYNTYVLTKMVLYILNEHIKNPDLSKAVFDRAVQDAEKYFAEDRE